MAEREAIETTIYDEYDVKLDAYQTDLDTRNASQRISIKWIKKRLDLEDEDFRTLRSKKIIRFSRGHRRNPYLNRKEARFIGYVWYFNKQGFPWKIAAGRADKFLHSDHPLELPL